MRTPTAMPTATGVDSNHSFAIIPRSSIVDVRKDIEVGEAASTGAPADRAAGGVFAHL
jgi:hypothetical protein